MNVRLLSVDTAVPRNRMSQPEALELARNIVCRDARDERLVRVLYRKACVENRNTAVPYTTAYQWTHGTETVTKGPTTGERMDMYAEHAPPVALEACRGALRDSGVRAGQVTHLITVSCTGFAAPGADIELIESLSLRPTVERVHVGFMGCHGAINGFRVAHAIAQDPDACVLMVAVELCSLHYRFDWDDEAITGNALFGDGAAAVVLRGAASPTTTSGQVELAATGSCLLADSKGAMSWRVGDFGFEMRLRSEVPDVIERNLEPWLTAWLDTHGIPRRSIAQWLVHPGGPRILDAVENALQLTPEHTAVSRTVLRQHGNMSSPTLLFILKASLEVSLARPSVMLAFGPGLIAEAALLV